MRLWHLSLLVYLCVALPFFAAKLLVASPQRAIVNENCGHPTYEVERGICAEYR